MYDFRAMLASRALSETNKMYFMSLDFWETRFIEINSKATAGIFLQTQGVVYSLAACMPAYIFALI